MAGACGHGGALRRPRSPRRARRHPLHWDEVADGTLSPARFTIQTIFERLAETPDPWPGMGRRRYGLARFAHRDRPRRAAAEWGPE